MGLWFIGQPDTALDMSLAGIRLAENLGHRVSLAHAFEFGGMLRVLRREIDILEEYANTVVAVGEELDEDRYQATGSLLAAWALSQRDRVVETHARIELGLNFLRTTGFIMPAPFYLGIAAEAYGHSGAPADGLRLIEEALSAVESSGVRFWEPELYRLKGELSLQLSNDNGENAEACFRQALAIAQTQHAMSLELRAAISLARLRKRQGRRDDTRELIGSVLGTFSEGFDTHDLRQARALLEA